MSKSSDRVRVSAQGLLAAGMNASALARLRYHAAEQLDQDVLGYAACRLEKQQSMPRDSYPT